MKYTTEIYINKPREEVVTLFDNPDNMKQWMEGLSSLELLSGTHGQAGSKSKLVFLNGKRKISMLETIIENNLPDSISSSYELNGVYNEVHNRFEVFTPNTTRYITEHTFKFEKLSMKVMAFIAPFIFKKQSKKYMQDFKLFVEGQN